MTDFLGKGARSAEFDAKLSDSPNRKSRLFNKSVLSCTVCNVSLQTLSQFHMNLTRTHEFDDELFFQKVNKYERENSKYERENSTTKRQKIVSL
jgi:hypothetical protein